MNKITTQENKHTDLKVYPLKYISEILESISDPVIVNDLNLNIVEWNSEAENVYGWKREDVIGKKLEDVIPIKNYSSDRREILAKIKQNGKWRGEVIQEKRNGTTLYGFATVSYLKDIHGEKIGYIAVVKDITSLKMIQERLASAQKSGGIGIFEVDLKKQKLWWSQSEMELLGVYPKEFTGELSNFRKKVFKKDLPSVLEEIQSAIKGKKKEFEQEFRVLRNDETRWIKGKGEVLFDENKNAIALRGANYDITDLKRLEENLRFKARVSKVLASSLNYEETLKSLAKLSVPTMADWCVIEMVTDEGKLEALEIQHIDKKRIEWAKKWRKNHPPTHRDTGGTWRVLNTGQTLHVPVVTEEMLKSAIHNKDEYEILKKIKFSSVIVVPITSFKKVVGTMTFISAESKRTYTDLDRELAEQIASRASLAIENSILYKTVEDERARLNSLLSDTPSIVWEVRSNRKLQVEKIIFISDYVKEMLGYTKKEAEASTAFWSSIIHTDDLKRVREEMKKISESKKRGVVRMRLLTKKGKMVWAESRCSAVLNEKGTPIGLRGITVDVTNLVESEERKDEFISLASHELRTPLTSLKVYNHLFAKNIRKINDKKLEEPLIKMGNQIDKLSNLISDLLDLSRIQAGKLLYKLEPISIDDLVTEIVENIETSFATHKIEIQGQTNKILMIDQNRIGQVLTNFLTNAAKYSAPKSKIVVRREVIGNDVIISVKDSGRGIPQKHQDKIFERFYQVDPEDKRTVSGLGIGLYICQAIIKKHHGRIGVTSKVGKGSEFYFALPIPNTIQK